MKNSRWFRLLAAATVAFASQMACGEPQPSGNNEEVKMIAEFMKDAQGRVSVFASQLAAFREQAMVKPQDAVAAYFDEKARRKWSSLIAPEMIDQQITDYFTGAIALSGPQDATSSIMALYNPWWDAIMLFRLDLKDSSPAPALRVSDFFLLSGETFRGDVASETNGEARVVTVVPESDPLSVEVWRVVSATRRRFVDAFPLDGKVTWGKMAAVLIGMNGKTEFNRIQTRSAVRLRLTLTFLKNVRDVGIATHITRLIRSGSELQLMTYFREPTSRPLTRLFAQLPEIFRKDFTPYGYVPTDKATLYVFVNKKVPRLYVTASLLKDITAKTSCMEWYDLLQADALLSAWNNRKEMSK